MVGNSAFSFAPALADLARVSLVEAWGFSKGSEFVTVTDHRDGDRPFVTILKDTILVGRGTVATGVREPAKAGGSDCFWLPSSGPRPGCACAVKSVVVLRSDTSISSAMYSVS